MKEWERKLNLFIKSNKEYPDELWLMSSKNGNLYARFITDDLGAIDTPEEWNEKRGISEDELDQMRRDKVDPEDLVVVRKREVKFYYKYDELSDNIRNQVIKNYRIDQGRAYAAGWTTCPQWPDDQVIDNLRHGAYLKDGSMIIMFWGD